MTKFLFVRHGEPDYDTAGDWAKVPLGLNYASLSANGEEQIERACERLACYDVDIIVSSPFTRTMQGAAIMARALDVPVAVERDLHEWIVDTTYSIMDGDKVAALCRDRDNCNGIYPEGETRVWESTEMVRTRVLNCLKKYQKYKCVVVSGHAIMMQSVFGINTPLEYGQIMELDI